MLTTLATAPFTEKINGVNVPCSTFIIHLVRQCFFKLGKIWSFENSLNQLLCSKIINFSNFGEKTPEKTHFIIL